MGAFARWQPHPEAMRFVPLFVGVNLVGSLNLALFPVWLASVGLSPESLGLLMAAMGIVRVVTSPIAGIAADALAARRMTVIFLMGVAAAAQIGFASVASIALIVGFTLIAAGSFSAIGPLLDGMTMRSAMASGFDYGHVRLCGSSAFLVMNIIGGVFIAASSVSNVPYAIAIAGLVSFAAAWALRRDHERPHPEHAAQVRKQAWALARQPLFVLFVAAAGMAQACHSFYYGFASLNWQALGYPADLIGVLWALGVLAEIGLFTVAARVATRFGATRLLVIGTACGVVRWTVTAFSPPLWVLIPIQLLHAGTFCAAHLGAMYFLVRATPAHLVGTAQSLYSAVTVGVFFTIGQYVSGLLFGSFGALGYLAMTVMSLIACGLSLLLGRLWDGGVLNIHDGVDEAERVA